MNLRFRCLMRDEGKGEGGACMFKKENASYPATKLLHFINKSVNDENNDFL